MTIVRERASTNASYPASESRIRFLTIVFYSAKVGLKFWIIIIPPVGQQFCTPLKQFAFICNTQENTLVGQKGKIGKVHASRKGHLTQFLGKCRVNKQ